MAEILNEKHLNKRSQELSIAVDYEDSRYSSPKVRDINVGKIRSILDSQSLVLTKVDKIWMLISLLVCVSLIVSNLYIQYNNTQLVDALNNYNLNTSQIQKQTNQMSEVITKQFDYEAIKATVKEENMTIDKSQIRTVEE